MKYYMPKITCLLTLSVLLIAAGTTVPASSAGNEINWQVTSNGGTVEGNSTRYILNGTVTQTAVGIGSSYDCQVMQGFWQIFQDTLICDNIPGDANNDHLINVGDAVYIVNYVFKGGAAPIPYATYSGDANGDCFCNVGDAVYLTNHVFKGGPPPVECQTWLDTCGSPPRR